MCCSACKNISSVTNPNKHIDKGIDIIIKYLKSGGTWKTTKGSMVQTSDTIDFELPAQALDDSFDKEETKTETEYNDFNPFG